MGELTLHVVGGIRFGTFTCSLDNWRWRETNSVGAEHLFAFPRVPVLIEPSDAPAFLAASTHAVVYDAGGHFRRQPVDPVGDRCTFLAVPIGLLAEQPRERYGLTPVVGPRTYALQDALERFLLGPEASESGADAGLCALVERVLPEPDTQLIPGPGPRRDLVESAKSILLAHPEESLRVEDLAARLSVSAFHLWRAFRQQTGYSLHAFRVQVRLRRALDQVADHRRDLAGLAADLGFSHHSHLTRSFRAAFGVAPSEAAAEPGSAALLRALAG